jgi:hypothetical protein
MNNKFICDDCGKELDVSKRCSPAWDICDDCLDNYDNKTGYCSVDCMITGMCDETC